MVTVKGKYTTATFTLDEVDEATMAQVTAMVNNEAFTNRIMLMPDFHAGKGSCIGFTMPLGEKIIPAVVGVDIGCGMLSTCLDNIQQPLEEVERVVREVIPTGTSVHPSSFLKDTDLEHVRKDTIFECTQFARAYKKKFCKDITPLIPDFSDGGKQYVYNLIDRVGIAASRFYNSLGSLGGGNHFIELGVDAGRYWLTVHTGSRNFGLKVAGYWQGVAAGERKTPEKVAEYEKEVAEIRSQFSNTKRAREIPELLARAKKKVFGTQSQVPKGMESLSGEQAAKYFFDMIFTQKYAEYNRMLISQAITRALNWKFKDGIETVHNFIDFRDLIIRKGAIRSYKGEYSIIPFNMRDGLLITNGKSNPEWNYSAPHGAGRVLSRSAAKKTLSLDRFKQQMTGVVSTSVCSSVLDEAPDAYKPQTTIEKAIAPTATIVHRVKPVMNIKDRG